MYCASSLIMQCQHQRIVYVGCLMLVRVLDWYIKSILFYSFRLCRLCLYDMKELYKGKQLLRACVYRMQRLIHLYCLISVSYLDLYVFGDDALIS